MKKASADYPDYVKITLDIEKGIVALGGEYHYDAEQVLLEKNSKQKDIWGGGLDLISQELDTVAMINIRPNRNPHQEIQNEKIKNKFLSLTYKFLKKYAKKPASLF
ncbi:hypothetical protein A2774_01680 [Candidatus Roizmanbacteria bacterium RIFCSPHIGHO2_01_FULL_39_12c]|uniref:Uncharacterized protein n=1 Tax=Candidatus Roizmanbacteria bacterium RIFCSPHIGHO2_01_FULL_39_12c TaxID=1802031 RepID=A0A1F7GB21_9BACT|nr:MAG: hypothetical protein A2774_01680 [Candidatus Roizmanbacteria bacterium RIFCSPHIGHO2_01_FULL_39_12c]OGK46939.1 MAG: hypothetical protein A2963_05090 [Candidatus Roizmanbacteria bacterium RIFCSPLOWO2_01_FULL_40_13]